MRSCLIIIALACQTQGSAPPAVSAEPGRLASPAPAAPPATKASDPTGAPGRALDLAGEPLHPGCILELSQQVNGDLVAHSIYGLIEGAKPCNDSNRFHQQTYWEGGILWFDQTDQGDRFGYQLKRALERGTFLLQTWVHTSGTYASTEYLLVRVDSLLETAIDPTHKPVQRKATMVTRLGEAYSEADAELLVDAVMKRAPAAGL